MYVEACDSQVARDLWELYIILNPSFPYPSTEYLLHSSEAVVGREPQDNVLRGWGQLQRPSKDPWYHVLHGQLRGHDLARRGPRDNVFHDEGRLGRLP